MVLLGIGVLALVFGGQAAWRSFRAAEQRAHALAAYTIEEVVQLETLSERLTVHGLALYEASSRLFPKVHRFLGFLDTPLGAAALPWILRRLFARPFRKGG